ncbi:hypothetical protein STANM309S_06662 [Streptomyces tanashiensis]
MAGAGVLDLGERLPGGDGAVGLDVEALGGGLRLGDRLEVVLGLEGLVAVGRTLWMPSAAFAASPNSFAVLSTNGFVTSAFTPRQ